MSKISRQELCAALAISESTVYRLELAGMPCTPVRRGKRYDLAECEQWLRATQQPTPKPAPDLSKAFAAFGATIGEIPESPPKPPPIPADVQGRFHASKRRAAQLQRRAPWANQAAIRDTYLRAIQLTEQTGVKHVVDHIYPLRGKLVSGLHVETNLQVLTESENSQKRNRFEVEP